MTRHLTLRGLALVCALSFARVAAADFVAPSFTDPIGSGVCGELDTVSQMQFPSYFSTHGGTDSTRRTCEALCRTAAAQCKQATSATAGCYLKGVARSQQFELSACGQDNTVALSVKECRSTVRSDLAASKAVIMAQRASKLAECVTWGSDCILSCDGP